MRHKKTTSIKKLKFWLVFCLMLISIMCYGSSHKITYQGRLRENGQPVNGTRVFKFRIYDAPEGGNLLWESSNYDVVVSTGVYSVVVDLSSATVNWSTGEYYLEVLIEGNPVAPRGLITSSVYAIYSSSSDYSKNSGLISGRSYAAFVSTWTENQTIAGVKTFVNNTIFNSKVGVGVSSPNSKLHVKGDDVIGGVLQVDAPSMSNVVYVSSTGKVGIGTTNPLAKLDVAGSVRAQQYGSDSTNVETVSGVYSPTKMVYVFDENRGIGYNNADDRIYFAMNETVPMVIDNDGSIGMGTTSPSTRLHVYESATNKNGVLIGIASTSSAYYALNVQSGGTSRLYVRADGNVGIGTMNPQYTLDVNGNIRVTGDWYWLPTKNFRLYPTANNQEWSFDLMNQGTYTGCYWQVWSDTKGTILSVRGDNGNVGIGTTSPDQKLTVAGNISLTNQIIFVDTATIRTSGNKKDLTLVTDAVWASETASGDITIKTGYSGSSGSKAGDIIIQTGDSNGEPGSITIKGGTGPSGGSVSIEGGGVDGSNYGGSVIIKGGPGYYGGNVEIRAGYSADNGGTIKLIPSGGGTPSVYVAPDGKVGIKTTNTVTNLTVAGLTGSASGSYLRYSTSNGAIYYDSSSLRYKDNVRPFVDDFSKILSVDPKIFVDKATGCEEIGYIAEDFERLGLTRLISYRDGQPDSLHYEKIVLYLLEVVKAQQKKIEELEAKLK